MRWPARVAAVFMSLGAALSPVGAQDLPGGDDDSPPVFLPFAYPPDGSRMMGGRPDDRGAAPGVTAPLVPAPVKPAVPAPRSHAELLDDLFHRLGSAADPDEAMGLASRIQRMWLDSGSDTADLLMSRAATAASKGDAKVAETILDKVVRLQPDWAEAWNKRATVRYLNDDDVGSMEDISHVLALQPRHFGALSGMGMILHRNGEDRAAMTALKRAEAVNPQDTGVKTLIEELKPAVEGTEL